MNDSEEVKDSEREVEKVGGWKRLSQKTVYENPWIRVTHEDVKRPNGTEGIYGIVHFKNRALGVVALDDTENLVMVKQSRYACDSYTLEIPEGGGPFHESPLQAAQRELEEETGLCARKWEKILTMHTSNSVTDEEAHIFLATDLFQGTQALEDTEDIEVLTMSLQDALEAIDRGDITDAMSVAAILKVALMRSTISK